MLGSHNIRVHGFFLECYFERHVMDLAQQQIDRYIAQRGIAMTAAYAPSPCSVAGGFLCLALCGALLAFRAILSLLFAPPRGKYPVLLCGRTAAMGREITPESGAAYVATHEANHGTSALAT